MNMGYARVSAKDQNPERQILKFRELGIEERFIFIDKQSGRSFDRPRYLAMREMVRKGDLIYLDALDRLGRDYEGILSEWKYFTRELEADIVCLDNETLFDSRKFKSMGDIGRVMEDQFLSLLAYLAEQELKKNKERQADGIKVARAEGVIFGRPKVAITPGFVKVYQEWKAERLTAVEAMKKAGMKKNTFYRRVQEYEEQLLQQEK